MTLASIPGDAPAEYRKQISTLLREPPADSVVTNLVNSHRDSNGNTILEQPVVNRPWEWIENLGEASSLDPNEEQREREERMRDRVAHLVKNTSSISLEHFGARHTGDTVKVNMASEDFAEMESYARGFEDGLSESVFARDWRETRLELEEELSPDMLARAKGEMKSDVLVSGGADNAQGDLPASSAISRTFTSIPNPHQSPAQGRQTNVAALEIIDLDDIPEKGPTSKTRQMSKRKAAAALSDEEIEIEEPVQVALRVTAPTVKKQKANKAPGITTRAKK